MHVAPTLPFATIAFFTCNYAALGHETIITKLENNKKLLQYVCAFFIVIGGYTTLNGIYHLDSIVELWNVFTDNTEVASKIA